MAGNDLQVPGLAIALIFHEHAKLVRLGRLDGIGVGIVADHVTLVEIFDIQRGVRPHGDRDFLHRNVELSGALDVVDHATDGVSRVGLKGGGVTRDEGELDGASGRSGDLPGAINRAQADEIGDLDVKQIVRWLAGGVADFEVESDSGDGIGFPLVGEFQGGPECGAGHHDFLTELDFDLGTSAALLAEEGFSELGGVREELLERLDVALRAASVVADHEPGGDCLASGVVHEVEAIAHWHVCDFINTAGVVIHGAVPAGDGALDQHGVQRGTGG